MKAVALPGLMRIASLNAERTVLSWATTLDRSGHVDQAVSLAGMVTDPRLASTSDRERASLLLEAARNDASHGDYASALLRLNQIRALGLTSATSEVAQLTPQYQVGEAVRLTVAGDGPDAVALLDAAAAEGASGQAAAARALPAAHLESASATEC